MTTDLAIASSDSPALADLHAEEARIRAGIELVGQGLGMVGQALQRIQDERKYLAAGYSSFESYVRECLGKERTWAYRQMWQATVVALLPSGNTVPESHARAFRPLEHDPEAIRQVWDELCAEHQAKLTRRHIDDAVQRRLKLDLLGDLNALMDRGELKGTGYTPDDVDDLAASTDAVPEMAGDLPEGELAQSPEEAAAHWGQGGRSQKPMKDIGLLYDEAQHAEFIRVMTNLKAAWQMTTVRDVVLEALKQADHARAS